MIPDDLVSMRKKNEVRQGINPPFWLRRQLVLYRLLDPPLDIAPSICRPGRRGLCHRHGDGPLGSDAYRILILGWAFLPLYDR